jgi:hypothetical protein
MQTVWVLPGLGVNAVQKSHCRHSCMCIQCLYMYSVNKAAPLTVAAAVAGAVMVVDVDVDVLGMLSYGILDMIKRYDG